MVIEVRKYSIQSVIISAINCNTRRNIFAISSESLPKKGDRSILDGNVELTVDDLDTNEGIIEDKFRHSVIVSPSNIIPADFESRIPGGVDQISGIHNITIIQWKELSISGNFCLSIEDRSGTDSGIIIFSGPNPDRCNF